MLVSGFARPISEPNHVGNPDVSKLLAITKQVNYEGGNTLSTLWSHLISRVLPVKFNYD